MKVFFLGNCQVNAMRGLFREMFPTVKATFQTITPYWDIQRGRDPRGIGRG